MKRLWAPWRMEYILADKRDECFLCHAATDENDRQNLLLKRGSDGAIVLNRFPYSNGHLMVFPYRHLADLHGLSSDEKLELMDLLDLSVEVLRQTINPDGFNIGVNLGEAAGAGLADHLHIHVVPRWNGDTNFMPVLDDTRVIPQSLLDMWDQLHPVLNPV